ncbi:MAG: hypothetical protein AAF690_13445 [Acidobacteriota bacterium]
MLLLALLTHPRQADVEIKISLPQTGIQASPDQAGTDQTDDEPDPTTHTSSRRPRHHNRCKASSTRRTTDIGRLVCVRHVALLTVNRVLTVAEAPLPIFALITGKRRRRQERSHHYG